MFLSWIPALQHVSLRSHLKIYMTRSSTEQKFIHDEVTRALMGAHLDYDNPIRAVLEREAEIVGVREAVVRVPGQNGHMLMLDDRLADLRRDPSYAAVFPADPPKVAKGDMAKLCQNFEKIVDGTVCVE
jgi:hypothetical protein